MQVPDFPQKSTKKKTIKTPRDSLIHDKRQKIKCYAVCLLEKLYWCTTSSRIQSKETELRTQAKESYLLRMFSSRCFCKPECRKRGN